MLVLSRRKDEKILIGDNLIVTVVDVRGDKIRLGVEAPAVSLHRQEVYDAILREYGAKTSPRNRNDYSELQLQVGERQDVSVPVGSPRVLGEKLAKYQDRASKRTYFFLGDFDFTTLGENCRLIRLTKCLDERLVEHFAEHPEHLYSLPPRAFEEFVAELFDGFGFDVTLTSRTRDHGRDVIAVRHEIYDERLLIECKQYASYDRLPRLPRFHLRN